MELWDAYNDRFEKIENLTLVRGEEDLIPDGVYHLVCDFTVRHSDGTYLLMQRDPRKCYPLMWEASGGGSALQNESPMECGKRELFEETGIKSENLKEMGREVNPVTRSAYVDFFCETDCDKESIVLQDGETVDFKWVTKEELMNMSDEELVTKRMFKFIDELKDMLS
ncbi:MAG: NUDIX hydrolase [Lachnospiraceae bacterium]|nr:NUDIX hydrolase [Lachnospiraceae bacterium]